MITIFIILACLPVGLGVLRGVLVGEGREAIGWAAIITWLIILAPMFSGGTFAFVGFFLAMPFLPLWFVGLLLGRSWLLHSQKRNL